MKSDESIKGKDFSELLRHIDRAMKAGKQAEKSRTQPSKEFLLPEVRLTKALREAFARVLPDEARMLNEGQRHTLEANLRLIVETMDQQIRSLGQWILEQAQQTPLGKAEQQDAMNRGKVLSARGPQRCGGCGKLLVETGAYEKHWQWGWVCYQCARLAKLVDRGQANTP